MSQTHPNDNGGWMRADDGWAMCYDGLWLIMGPDGQLE